MKKQKILRLKSAAYVSALIGLMFSATSIVSAATANTTINSTISSVISVSTSGTVTLNVLPTGSGSQTIGSDTVTVNTNDVAGYTLTLSSTSSSTSALASGGNTIPASSGTQASPVVQSANTWGYCVSSIGGFSTFCPSVGVSNQAIGSNKFAGVPLSAAANTIATTATTATNATTTVWYAVAANSSQASGLYTGTVVYTATAN
jgi:hypothetical protein